MSIWAWQDQFSGSVDVRGDVIASALQVANWRDLAQGQSYGELIGAAQPGPLDHFWSLSIEEQFYIFMPVFLFFMIRKKIKFPLTVVSFLIAVSLIMRC